MDFTELRNSVEHVAAGIRQAGVDEHGPDQDATLLAQAYLTLGQVAVGIYEELAAIRRTLEAIALSERPRPIFVRERSPEEPHQ